MKHLLIALLSIISLTVFGQSPTQIRAIRPLNNAEPFGPSAANPWQVGAKLSFAVRDLDGSLENNFIFAGKATGMLLESDRFAIPIYGSIGLGSNDLFSNESGVNGGIYPYYIASSGEKSRIIVHGGAGYKVIPGSDSLDLQTQFKLSAGVEVHLFKDATSLPTTISVAPAMLIHDADTENTAALELTAIVPISKGLGVLAEYLQPFKKDFDGVLRIGVIAVGQL